jgi:hypothetical protein
MEAVHDMDIQHIEMHHPNHTYKKRHLSIDTQKIQMYNEMESVHFRKKTQLQDFLTFEV